MARYWLHNGFLDMRGEKMSKSLGNVVPDAGRVDIAAQSGEAVRLHLLSTHYRQPADFQQEADVSRPSADSIDSYRCALDECLADSRLDSDDR